MLIGRTIDWPEPLPFYFAGMIALPEGHPWRWDTDEMIVATEKVKPRRVYTQTLEGLTFGQACREMARRQAGLYQWMSGGPWVGFSRKLHEVLQPADTTEMRDVLVKLAELARVAEVQTLDFARVLLDFEVKPHDLLVDRVQHRFSHLEH
ncbi:hypothetical protein SEA_VORRPS_92 [Mycobacterium phage Vorrps]|nr:hypothetical protein SEA_VORRPS_92 [Mycobacterium phage Vorrps]QXO13465.1 hypothetical protein SEA_MURAI_93 [Mycobacterium phage Murai]UAW08443.1 hypothetical protein SEA_MORI_92 [Mycobacterium phage Mori]WNO28678.1 hypothetical protein SEA_MADKILLAH_94 [Mycobacterium phage MadKillah]